MKEKQLQNQVSQKSPATYDAASVMVAERQFGIEAKNVISKYEWFPNFREVYVGTGLPNTYFHSVWVGVFVTILNIPFMLWALLFKPVILAVWYGITGFIMAIFGLTVAGLTGRAVGIKVDSDKFETEVGSKFGAMLSPMLARLMPQPDETKTEAAPTEEQK